MKRVLSLILCLVLCLSLLPAAAAEDIEIVETAEDPISVIDPVAVAEEAAVSNSDSGVYFQRANWEYNSHILYLKHKNWASGEPIEYIMFEDERPWSAYLDDIWTIILDEGCVGIDPYAFRDYPHLRQITMPYTLGEICNGAFQNCPELQSITLPGITKIEKYTFDGCRSLRSITIPSTVTEVGEYAFADTAVESLEFQSNLTKLADYALADMSSLSTVTFRGSLPEIGDNSFAGVTATVYTPTGSRAWPVSAMKNYGGTLTWANMPEGCEITSVAVTITPPSVGASPDYYPGLPAGANYVSDNYNNTNVKNGVRWEYDTEYGYHGYMVVGEDNFVSGRQYNVVIYLAPKSDYIFSNSCTGTINGKTAQTSIESDGTIRLDYQFPALASKPVITTQPKSVTATAGSTAKFTVAATGATSYQWQYRTSSTGSWYNSTASTAKSATFTVTAETYRSGYQYRCKVTNSAGSVTSSAATLTVVSKPAITSHPKTTTAAEGATVNFTVKATGGSLTYQWYYRTSASGTWTKCTGTGYNTATLSVKAVDYREGYQYRCLVKNSAGSIYTNNAALHILAKPAITTHPKTTTVAEGETVNFTVKATGGNLSYQWYYRTGSSGEWSKCTGTGCNTATLSVKAVAYREGYQYRCLVSNSLGSIYTNNAALHVLTKPAITTQPASKTATAGETVKFTVKATGGNLSYQWYYRVSSSGTWTKCSGTGYNTATLSVEAKAYRSGYQYRCLVKNTAGETYTNAVTLTVK